MPFVLGDIPVLFLPKMQKMCIKMCKMKRSTINYDYLNRVTYKMCLIREFSFITEGGMGRGVYENY